MSRNEERGVADLSSLDRLTGHWDHVGGVRGRTRYEWTEGRYFLLQHVDLERDGRSIRGIEVIGRLHPWDGEPSPEIRSRFYSFLDGRTFDYVYEIEGDVLTIWGGERGSPSFFRGTFGEGGESLIGGWQWPGGGYRATAHRLP